MKKLYLLLTAIALTVVSGYSQNLQNANWYFGDFAGVTFLPNPSAPTGVSNSAMHAYESAASVSDPTGQLLFYTNGWTVYNRQHQVMTNGNGLLGDLSNSQMAIVPRPGYPDRYYIIAMDGSSGYMNGLTYSEVDMAIGTDGAVTSTKNVFFKDHNGVTINSPYNLNGPNYSEKVTTTKHCNGVDYWIVTQIKDNIYSYKVTSSGISVQPVVSPAYIGSSLPGNGQGNIKISPDNKRIAICYSSNNGGVMLGQFNSATGQVILDPNVISLGNMSYFRLEFSPSSQYVYFSAGSALYVTSAYSNTATLVTNAVPINAIQRALNDKIYITYGIVAHNSHLAVLNDPDNAANPDFQTNAIDLSPAYHNGYTNLPPWVYRHGAGCDDHIVLTIPEGNITHEYKYSNYVQAEGNYKIISSLQDITMQAGNYIVLKPDVYIKSGSKYYGHIEDCGSNLRLAIAVCQESQSQTEEVNEVSRTGLQLFPNPAKDIVNFSLPDEIISQVTISSLSGLTLIQEQPKDNAVNVSRLEKGIYIVVITTQSGKTYNKNLAIE
ncbi:T9SS type A sorting domain-containing protein [Flavobacterium hauense]